MQVKNIKNNIFLINVKDKFLFIESAPFSIFEVDDLNRLALEYWETENKRVADKIYSTLIEEKIIESEESGFWTIDENYLTFLYIWSTKCNLGCPHCLAGEGDYGMSQGDMSIETFKKALDLQEKKLHICAMSGNYESLEIGGYFFGGEPLINANNLIIALEEYKKLQIRLSKEYPDIDFIFSSSVSTNGTLMTSELAEKFKKLGVEVILSIDGPDHDKARPYRSGQPSLKDVISALNLLRETGNQVRINTVILPDQMSMISERVKWFEKLLKGAENVRVTYSFERGAVGHINEAGCKYNHDCIDAYKKEVSRYIGDGFNTYEVELLRKISVCGTSHKCSAGLERLCIVPNGDIYPCQSFIDEEFLIGNINDDKLDYFNSSIAEMFKKRHIDNISPCSTCYLKSICNVSFDCASHSNYDLNDFYAVDFQTCKAGYEVETKILEKMILEQLEG